MNKRQMTKYVSWDSNVKGPGLRCDATMHILSFPESPGFIPNVSESILINVFLNRSLLTKFLQCII